MTDLILLEREMYAEAEAARLLNVAPSTLHHWLEGKAGRAGRVHLPVIRQEAKGVGAAVTWAEFVEAGLLHGADVRRRLAIGVNLHEGRERVDRAGRGAGRTGLHLGQGADALAVGIVADQLAEERGVVVRATRRVLPRDGHQWAAAAHPGG